MTTKKKTPLVELTPAELHERLAEEVTERPQVTERTLAAELLRLYRDRVYADFSLYPGYLRLLSKHTPLRRLVLQRPAEYGICPSEVPQELQAAVHAQLVAGESLIEHVRAATLRRDAERLRVTASGKHGFATTLHHGTLLALSQLTSSEQTRYAAVALRDSYEGFPRVAWASNGHLAARVTITDPAWVRPDARGQLEAPGNYVFSVDRARALGLRLTRDELHQPQHYRRPVDPHGVVPYEHLCGVLSKHRPQQTVRVHFDSLAAELYLVWWALLDLTHTSQRRVGIRIPGTNAQTYVDTQYLRDALSLFAGLGCAHLEVGISPTAQVSGNLTGYPLYLRAVNDLQVLAEVLISPICLHGAHPELAVNLHLSTGRVVARHHLQP